MKGTPLNNFNYYFNMTKETSDLGNKRGLMTERTLACQTLRLAFRAGGITQRVVRKLGGQHQFPKVAKPLVFLWSMKLFYQTTAGKKI